MKRRNRWHPPTWNDDQVAERLQADFPSAKLRLVPDAGTYVMLDKPSDLAEAIVGLR